MPVFNDFDFRIALAPQRGANFGDLNFQKCPDHASFKNFDFRIALAPQRGANFGDLNFQKCPDHASFKNFDFRIALAPQRGANFGHLSFKKCPEPLIFPECVARVPVSLGGLGVRLCSPSFAFATATVRNRPQPSATACGDAVRLSTVASVSGVDQKACQIERLSPQLYWRLQRRCLRE